LIAPANDIQPQFVGDIKEMSYLPESIGMGLGNETGTDHCDIQLLLGHSFPVTESGRNNRNEDRRKKIAERRTLKNDPAKFITCPWEFVLRMLEQKKKAPLFASHTKNGAPSAV
jgi:hypothetical protein